MNSADSFKFEDDANEDEDDDASEQEEQAISSQRLDFFQNPFDTMIQSYLDCLEDDPLVTKSVTCAVVSALGAILGNLPLSQSEAQRKKQGSSNHSGLQKISEVCAFALYGGLVGGPLTHFWTQWLERNVRKAHRSTSWSLLVDQLIAQPPMLFLMHLTLDMAGAAFREAPRAWNRSLERTGQSVVASWRFWPAAVYIM